ncbi:MAG: hypothetical protein HY900_07010 [Deltaproteobacteria bacterium]|nr:hypothetical protein [Deltaproteobacteria bacterium]
MKEVSWRGGSPPAGTEGGSWRTFEQWDPQGGLPGRTFPTSGVPFRPEWPPLSFTPSPVASWIRRLWPAAPLLSGHLGGASDLARLVAHCLGTTAVVTIATGALERARREGLGFPRMGI